MPASIMQDIGIKYKNMCFSFDNFITAGSQQIFVDTFNQFKSTLETFIFLYALCSSFAKYLPDFRRIILQNN